MTASTAAARGPRMLGRGDLGLLVLALLAEQPRHGYELIQHVSDLFAQAYTPSAGTMYPLLARFERSGWVQAEGVGSRRMFAITAAGLAERQARDEQVRQAQRRAWGRAREVAKAALPVPLRDAMQALKQALLRRHGRWQPGDAEQVAALLDAATAALNRLPPAAPER